MIRVFACPATRLPAVLLAALLITTTLSADPQQADAPKPAQVAFQFLRPGVEVPEFVLEVNEDGSGRYKAEQVYVGPGISSGPSSPTQHIDRGVSLSPATTRAIFAAARELNRFNDPCASPAKNIADTGKKTLRYTGEGGDGTCTYNYAQDKRVVLLTQTFEAIAATLDLGRKLDFDHRFDRLGLDAVTARLVEETDAGRAIELGTIAPTLRSLAEDADLLERVRSRANKLLQQTQAQDQSHAQRRPAS